MSPHGIYEPGGPLGAEGSREHLAEAVELIATVLEFHLPADDDAVKPPPHWPGWRMAYALIHAKIELQSILRDLDENTQSAAT